MVAYRLLYKRLWFDSEPDTAINLAGLIPTLPSNCIPSAPHKENEAKTRTAEIALQYPLEINNMV